MPERPFRVLHVCTGNICRSPMAELLMRVGLGERLAGHVEVASAGTWGHEGSAMEPDALRALRDRGADGSAFLPGGSPAERGHALGRAAGALRGRVVADPPGDDDLADPHRGPLAGSGRCADLIATALRTPLDLLAGT